MIIKPTQTFLLYIYDTGIIIENRQLAVNKKKKHKFTIKTFTNNVIFADNNLLLQWRLRILY